MKVGDYPVTVQAAVSDRLPVLVLVGREVPGFDKLLGATLCGGSTEATKVVATQSQRGHCDRNCLNVSKEVGFTSLGPFRVPQGWSQVR